MARTAAALTGDILRGMTSRTRPVSGEEYSSSGNLEISSRIGGLKNFLGNMMYSQLSANGHSRKRTALLVICLLADLTSVLWAPRLFNEWHVVSI